jgi:hypothetical protein
MSVADVAAVLGRYDDEAWIALANRGLLRRARKDLETQEVRVTSETHEGVEIAVGDRAVRIGVAGPGEAVCSCPSVVICQHIITAGLWLASAAPGPSDRREAVPAADRLHDDLMAIDAATLTSYAGLPGYRWAHQMLDDQATPPSVTRDSYLTVTFERPPLTVRYLGGGLDGLVLDQPVSHVERLRVAAVLAWQRRGERSPRRASMVSATLPIPRPDGQYCAPLRLCRRAGTTPARHCGTHCSTTTARPSYSRSPGPGSTLT